jgi:hypothetical protein
MGGFVWGKVEVTGKWRSGNSLYGTVCDPWLAGGWHAPGLFDLLNLTRLVDLPSDQQAQLILKNEVQSLIVFSSD